MTAKRIAVNTADIDAIFATRYQEGEEHGIELGMEMGMERGIKQKQKEVAVSLINLGTAMETIMLVTGLTENEIDAIKRDR
jgi:predicted transposase YdaD